VKVIGTTIGSRGDVTLGTAGLDAVLVDVGAIAVAVLRDREG
jgi:hypothetical protein